MKMYSSQRQSVRTMITNNPQLYRKLHTYLVIDRWAKLLNSRR